jgi:endo-1,4-beta-xylanase
LKSLIQAGATISISKQSADVVIPTSIFENTDQETTITVTKLERVENALSDVYDFTIRQGSNIISTFLEPVTLKFKVDLDKVTNPELVKVFYWNEKLEGWELIGGTYKDGVVIAETTHFSIYTVFETTKKELSAEGLVPHINEKDTSSPLNNVLLLSLALLAVATVTLYFKTVKR